MKKYNKYLKLFLLSLVIYSCDNEDVYKTINDPVNNTPLSTDGLDFSKYVSVGASLTSGYTDNALFIAGQENSFPNTLAKKFALANGGEFTQPLMNDNIGGIINDLDNNKLIQNPRLFFNGSGPAVLEAMPTTTLTPSVTTTGNFGVPGAKSFHFLAAGYGNSQGVAPGLANPYFARFASSATATILEDAVAQSPTFFTLSEIGGNDVLGYALAGGTGIDQSLPTEENPTGNIDPSTYGSTDITHPNVFAQAFSTIVNELTKGEAKGVVANLPDVTSLPFFTTVPNNALVLDAETAAQLTGVFQAVAGIFIAGLKAKGIPDAQAQALGAQYAIPFNEGSNRWIIKVPKTEQNPLAFRQMTEEELLLLTIDREALKTGYGSVTLTPEVMQVLGKLQQGAQPTPEEGQLVIDAVTGIDDKDALDNDELESIGNAISSYNNTILSVADAKDLAFVDLNGLLEKASTTGIDFDGYVLTTDLVTGGLISLDGVHLTARGYALMANEILRSIDQKYGSNFAKAKDGLAKANDYPTNYKAELR